MDGLTPISDAGMKDWFRDNLQFTNILCLGTYDENKKEYNITFNNDTLSFKENNNGWVSRKSFLQEDGVTLNNKYYTFKNGDLWIHDNETRNTFYNTSYRYNSSSTSNFESSKVKFIFNDAPGSIKQFKTLNYEGSKARIFQDNSGNADTDNNFYNKNNVSGWWTNSIESDKQSGQILSYEEKEGKWFNYIQGTQSTLSNLDTSEFSVQGIGLAGTSVTASSDYSYKVTITVNENND